MFALAEDEWGTWLWTPPGSRAQRGAEPAQTFNHLNVKLISAGQWWTAIWNDSKRFDLYIDIVTPPAWRSGQVTMVDLDLDVIRLDGGEVVIDDEDEFAHHQIAYGYPATVVAKARQTADSIRTKIANGEEPFNEVGNARMEEAARLASAGGW
jgi:predicted RNA-binding protein associated with RNAse of E/G family